MLSTCLISCRILHFVNSKITRTHVISWRWNPRHYCRHFQCPHYSRHRYLLQTLDLIEGHRSATTEVVPVGNLFHVSYEDKIIVAPVVCEEGSMFIEGKGRQGRWKMVLHCWTNTLGIPWRSGGVPGRNSTLTLLMALEPRLCQYDRMSFLSDFVHGQHDGSCVFEIWKSVHQGGSHD